MFRLRPSVAVAAVAALVNVFAKTAVAEACSVAADCSGRNAGRSPTAAFVGGACTGAGFVLPTVLLGLLLVGARVGFTVARRALMGATAQDVESVDVGPWRSLPFSHAWVAALWPEHHFAGPAHAARFLCHILVLMAGSAVGVHNWGALAEASGGAAVGIGGLAALAATALHAALAALFHARWVEDRRLEQLVPVTADHPQDLVDFGVRPLPYVGVSHRTIAGEGPPRRGSGEAGDVASDWGSEESATAPEAKPIDARRLPPNPRTWVRIRCRASQIVAHVVNAGIACGAAACAHLLVGGLCGGRLAAFWVVLAVAAVLDAAVLQPAYVALLALCGWVVADGEPPFYDNMPIDGQWIHTGPADGVALRVRSERRSAGTKCLPISNQAGAV